MSKERLEEIEAKYSTLTVADERDGIEYIEVDIKDLVFLIQNGFKQAKRVQGLEKSLGSLIKQNKEMRKSVGFYTSESYNAHLERLLDKRERQIQDLRIDVSFYKMASEHYEYVEKQNKRYREALEFYADKENYKPFDGIFLSSYQNKVDEDGGHTARKALEGEE